MTWAENTPSFRRISGVHSLRFLIFCVSEHHPLYLRNKIIRTRCMCVCMDATARNNLKISEMSRNIECTSHVNQAQLSTGFSNRTRLREGGKPPLDPSKLFFNCKVLCVFLITQGLFFWDSWPPPLPPLQGGGGGVDSPH